MFFENFRISQIKSRENSEGHKSNIQSNSQTTFNFSSGLATWNRALQSLSLEDKIVKAEILPCLQLVNSNYSFASTESDGERFQAMFPDSEIARNYKQSKAKVPSSVQFEIAEQVMNTLVKDFSKHLSHLNLITSQISNQEAIWWIYPILVSKTWKSCQCWVFIPQSLWSSAISWTFQWVWF